MFNSYQHLERDVTEIKRDVKDLRMETKADLEHLRAENATAHSEVTTELRELSKYLNYAVGAVAFISLLAAVIPAVSPFFKSNDQSSTSTKQIPIIPTSISNLPVHFTNPISTFV